jgi:hypothetical protein
MFPYIINYRLNKEFIYNSNKTITNQLGGSKLKEVKKFKYQYYYIDI